MGGNSGHEPWGLMCYADDKFDETRAELLPREFTSVKNAYDILGGQPDGNYCTYSSVQEAEQALSNVAVAWAIQNAERAKAQDVMPKSGDDERWTAHWMESVGFVVGTLKRYTFVRGRVMISPPVADLPGWCGIGTTGDAFPACVPVVYPATRQAVRDVCRLVGEPLS